MTWQEIVDLARESIQCPRCGQPPGFRCITKSGRWATRQHDVRTRPVQKAWVAGMKDGERDMLDAYIDHGESLYFASKVRLRREERGL